MEQEGNRRVRCMQLFESPLFTFRLRWFQFGIDLEPLTGCKNVGWTRQPLPNHWNTLAPEYEEIKAIRLMISTDNSVNLFRVQCLTLSPMQNSIFMRTKVGRAHKIVLAWI